VNHPRSAPGRRPRVYAATGGRVQAPDSDIRLDTHITTTPGTLRRPASAHHGRILRECATARAVAELAAVLDLPVGVVTVLVTELRDQGLLQARAPLDMTDDNTVTVALLERLRDGLRRMDDAV
jgi:hypothetical protein